MLENSLLSPEYSTLKLVVVTILPSLPGLTTSVVLASLVLSSLYSTSNGISFSSTLDLVPTLTTCSVGFFTTGS